MGVRSLKFMPTCGLPTPPCTVSMVSSAAPSPLGFSLTFSTRVLFLLLATEVKYGVVWHSLPRTMPCVIRLSMLKCKCYAKLSGSALLFPLPSSSENLRLHP